MDAKSLSARRAWIEISARHRAGPQKCWSLSARRAWIEIASSLDDILAGVSLSARRAWIEIIHTAPKGSDNEGRSPQGERG